MTDKFAGAWLTDIDDTLIESGLMPDDAWINWLSKQIKILNKHNICWVPMSGVALVKLGPRILYRLPEELLSGVLYYGGDGSELYYYEEANNTWISDGSFKRIFTDAQALAVIGKDCLSRAYAEMMDIPIGSSQINQRIETAESVLAENGLSADYCIIDILKQRLFEHGYNPDDSETYLRGGSVSWMMLGDTSADPYKTDKAVSVRREIISLAEEILFEHDSLLPLGITGIDIPFHGARGIKFVLKGNDKERGTRDLVERKAISPGSILFAGNELFKGGNDNMIRNIDGVTLLSVGEKTDPGENVVYGGPGVEANRKWMENVCSQLEQGVPWPSILADMKKVEASHGRSL